LNYSTAEFQISAYNVDQLPPSDKPEIVFSGKSNVGKSSLINKLFNRKRLARVSGAPGKTASINYYSCDDVWFVDLPGYGFARVSRGEKSNWAELVDGYLKAERKIAVLIQLLDIRHKPSEDDMQMIYFLKETKCNFLIALTKADKLKKSELAARLEEFPKEIAEFGEIPFIVTSAENGEGINKLKHIIEDSI
jgi:GTP-binding protein